MSSLKNKVLNGLLWRFLERTGTQGIQFIISIILARLLLPKDFGTIGIISVFIVVANVFIQNGFGSALIQKKEVDDKDYSSVFYINLSVSIILYIILYVSSPLIARFYAEPLLISMLRILSLTLILGAINSIQNAIISREMKFKNSFFMSLGGIFTSGTVGIVMAYYGYGIWSLVFSQLSGQVISTIILWYSVCWRPQLVFSVYKIKELFRFGSKLLFSGLLDTIFNNLYPLIIGRLFEPTMLGYYNRGQSMPALLVNNINGTITSVMFPALSSCQSDIFRVKVLLRRMIVTSTFLVFPMMFGLALVSRQFVLLFLTEKWLPSVPFIQLSCITYTFWPIHTANLQAINAIGRSDIFLKLEIIKKTLFIIVIAISFPFGIYTMIFAGAILSIICTFINSWPNRILLNYTFREQLIDIIPSFLLSAAMGGVIILISMLPISIWLLLFLQIFIGIIFYFSFAYLFKLECLDYLLNIVLKRSEEG